MGIIKYVEDGKSFYEVRVKVRDPMGKQLSRRRRGISSEPKAKRLELELKMELLKAKDDRTTPFWEEWVDTCLERVKREYKPSTVMNYRSFLGKWVTPHLKGKAIDKIKQSDIHDILFVRCKSMSDSSRRDLLKYIRRVFGMAIEETLLVHNPAVGIKIKVVEKKLECLNNTELSLLLYEAYNKMHPFYNIWTLALLTGMRSGELHALLWTDIDFENRFISVNKSWSYKNGVGPTKNSKNREVPMSDELIKFLKELKLRTRGPHVLTRNKDWDNGMQAEVLRKFCEEIGITSIRFHDLRSTFITQLLLNDVPLVKVMYIVGHARMQTTQRYLRKVAKEVQGATEALNITLPTGPVEGENVVQLKR